MKKTLLYSLMLILYVSVFSECKKDKEDETLAGTPGNPRFNLQFTNPENVDLDLHVLTPDGNEIYYGNSFADGGSLDIDCLCDECPNGPNENIYWVEGTAPKGNYKFWVEYYGDCGSAGSSSDYTLRLVRNSTVLETYKGTLTSEGQKSEIHTFTY